METKIDTELYKILYVKKTLHYLDIKTGEYHVLPETIGAIVDLVEKEKIFVVEKAIDYLLELAKKKNLDEEYARGYVKAITDLQGFLSYKTGK